MAKRGHPADPIIPVQHLYYYSKLIVNIFGINNLETKTDLRMEDRRIAEEEQCFSHQCIKKNNL